MPMTNVEEAPHASRQHKKPCHDCPMRRKSIPGWLGGFTPEEYRSIVHSDTVVNCHALNGPQCAGVAIYRNNVCKRIDPPNLNLPGDTDKVFATPMEFISHHLRKKSGN